MKQEPIGQNVGYIRVSTTDQSIARQEAAMATYHIDRLFIDYASGKDIDRPQLSEALGYLRQGDTLIISSLDRLARNLSDLKNIINDLTQRNVQVISIKEALQFTSIETPISNLLLSLMGAFAEFERMLIRERQLEGIALAKQKGIYKGRKPCLTLEQIDYLRFKDQEDGGKQRSALARELGISRQSLYNYLKL